MHQNHGKNPPGFMSSARTRIGQRRSNPLYKFTEAQNSIRIPLIKQQMLEVTLFNIQISGFQHLPHSHLQLFGRTYSTAGFQESKIIA